MYKFRFYLNFEKEEKWLNKMAKEGFEFSGKHIFYKFKKSIPKDTIIRIDYRTFDNIEDFADYKMIFKDSGWQHVEGTKTSGIQYFKRVNEDVNKDIFSDMPSKSVRYKKMSNMWLTLALSYIPILFVLIVTKAFDFNAILNPKILYYTPGLWEKTGFSFWIAFLFETPFVLMRGFLIHIFLIAIILYLVFSIISEMNYRRYTH